MTPGEFAAGIQAASWLTVAAMLVALAATILCATIGFLAYRALAELRALARGMSREGVSPDAPTETIPAAYPPGSMPLDARPVAARVRPYLAHPHGRHGAP